ncbi:lysophospholipid acyltransferase family protein [Curvivirga aplysinae]|uniref:lysophospholipid acyltransferase family protein n=1 Tax=Curvivirga aplysinae TaxID=2529852 RepID=UPI0012BD0EC8|nr:lauroyl acyltransferase [Curvivirga aplysinae]MTI10839.1 lauroyl acyltransferase [Curvivirga aplysinae]
MAHTSERHRQIKRWLIYHRQAVFVYAFYYLLRFVPVTIAAAFGAFIFRIIGPYMSAHKTALRNLEMAFPEKSPKEREKIAREVWDNLGRGAGEYMQVDTFTDKGENPRILIEGAEHLIAARDSGERFIIFSAHMANWEVATIVAALHNVYLTNVYRHASNPYVDKLIRKIRGKFTGTLIPKGRKGAKQLFIHFKKGAPLGMLVDQKLNEGIPVPFFGEDCMTATAPAELALRFDCPIIPTQLIRLPGSRFKVIINPPMEKPNTGDMKADTLTLLTEINKTMEGWIRENPGQWFWVHKRWPRQ